VLRLLSSKFPVLALQFINSIVRNAPNADGEVSSDDDDSWYVTYIYYPLYS
jgi:hypothetical protein